MLASVMSLGACLWKSPFDLGIQLLVKLPLFIQSLGYHIFGNVLA